MRIREALQHHYNKHMLTYGLISAVAALTGACFIPDVVRAIYKLVHESLGWTLAVALAYGLIVVVVAIPAVIAVMWIADKWEEKK